MTSTEDMVFFITSNNQLVKWMVSLDGTDEESIFTSVVYDFHSA